VGYDFRTVQPMTAVETAAYNETSKTFFAAVKVRDSLPKEESGQFDVKRAQEEKGLDWEAHELYPGRTQRYIEAQDAVNDAYEALIAADRTTFRLNIGGMGRYHTAMGLLGMLQTRSIDQTPPEWPESDTIGDDDWEAVYAEIDNRLIALSGGQQATDTTLPVRKTISDYADAMIRKLTWTPTPVTGIYSECFSSNDGWVVSPAQIDAALTTYRTHTGETVKAALEKAGISEQGRDYWLKWLGFLQYAMNQGGFRVN
jgi:hypothetical protein